MKYYFFSGYFPRKEIFIYSFGFNSHFYFYNPTVLKIFKPPGWVWEGLQSGIRGGENCAGRHHYQRHRGTHRVRPPGEEIASNPLVTGEEPGLEVSRSSVISTVECRVYINIIYINIMKLSMLDSSDRFLVNHWGNSNNLSVEHILVTMSRCHDDKMLRVSRCHWVVEWTNTSRVT